MLPQKPTESRPEQKKKKKNRSHHTTMKGKIQENETLAEKSKHRHSNEPNLQTKIKNHLISSALLKEVTKPKIYRKPISMIEQRPISLFQKLDKTQIWKYIS